MRLADEAGFLPRIAQEAPDPYGLLALVGVGAGIAIVVESSDHIRIDGVSYVPLAEGAEAFTLAWAGGATIPRRHSPESSTSFREILPKP